MHTAADVHDTPERSISIVPGAGSGKVTSCQLLPFHTSANASSASYVPVA